MTKIGEEPIIYDISQKRESDMARPKKCRRICGMPQIDGFVPLLRESAAEAQDSYPPVEMTLEEYESVRLIDLLGCTQEDCARQMEVARTTVQAVYDSARKKLAEALVRGRALAIRGGSYVLCPQAGQCCGENCGSCVRCAEDRCSGCCRFPGRNSNQGESSE